MAWTDCTVQQAAKCSDNGAIGLAQWHMLLFEAMLAHLCLCDMRSDACNAAVGSCLQVDNMTNKHAVFMTRDGRISLAGLSSAKTNYLADAIVDSVRNF